MFYKFLKASHRQFWLGLVFGLLLAFVLSTYHDLLRRYSVSRNHVAGGDHDDVHDLFDKKIANLNVRNFMFEDTHEHHDDDKIAKELAKTVRVLCWVMTAPKNLDRKASAVKATWAKRCNKVIFFSSVTNTSFPTVGLNVSEGRQHLTAKTMKAFQYIYEHHLNDADWFLKADDDTYVIVENLRYFLSSQNTSKPVYFGHHFKPIVKQGYYSGGAGYVIGREALMRFGKHGNDTKLCRPDGGAEDASFGSCMEKLGVKTGNSTDVLARTRFHCFDPETHLFGGFPDWYYSYDANGVKKGIESISDYAITFHYVSPPKMYGLEFFIYHLRPYGIISGFQNLNRKPES